MSIRAAVHCNSSPGNRTTLVGRHHASRGRARGVSGAPSGPGAPAGDLLLYYGVFAPGRRSGPRYCAATFTRRRRTAAGPRCRWWVGGRWADIMRMDQRNPVMVTAATGRCVQDLARFQDGPLQRGVRRARVLICAVRRGERGCHSRPTSHRPRRSHDAGTST